VVAKLARAGYHSVNMHEKQAVLEAALQSEERGAATEEIHLGPATLACAQAKTQHRTASSSASAKLRMSNTTRIQCLTTTSKPSTTKNSKFSALIYWGKPLVEGTSDLNPEKTVGSMAAIFPTTGKKWFFNASIGLTLHFHS
jgi:hypothetical protein